MNNEIAVTKHRLSLIMGIQIQGLNLFVTALGVHYFLNDCYEILYVL